jgi:sterol desaturase/sphingolipid hydroxylase (fatty acid hydroxylase superfamily)
MERRDKERPMDWMPEFSRLLSIFSVFFYATMIALEALVARFQVAIARYRVPDSFASMSMGVGYLLAGAVTSGVTFAVLSFVYKVRFFTMSPDSLWSWIALFFLDDLCYYWFHRISHECRFWWASHVNHHSSEYYNLSTAVRQPWTGGITGTWLVWAPLGLLGFPPEMILIQQSINLFYQFWIHTEVIRRMPRWFELVFNTPSHHRVHHAVNPRYLDRNYAGILMVWDRLFGTFSPEVDEERARYGIVHNLDTFNPLKIAFHEWLGMARDVAGARSLREAAGCLFGPPGWRRQETAKQIRAAWEESRRAA